MKTGALVSDPEARKTAGIWRRSGVTWITNCPPGPHGVVPLCYTNGRLLSGLIFRILRETLAAIILTTDPQKVRETLGLLESEPALGRVTHD
jgi:hypothetical protein